MAIGYAHTLFCDRRGCRAKVTVTDTRDAAHARRLAHRRHGWRSDSDGDWCPTDKTARDTTRTRPATSETPSHDKTDTSHTGCDSKGER
ncbi:hypothetical protein ACIP6V_23790 [Streptomyces sp. NPDC088770]|uniref:hypothetical protein n=1 Tax=unclassified Streptomyces TaxID=2593676 RepID=UPI002DD7BC44|nr:hypothetical protein [Streptomyces sp. NBC_01788]WSB29698.1 hypothetical protein OIE49_29545 [Streptomyces sp. NBC_01788]